MTSKMALLILATVSIFASAQEFDEPDRDLAAVGGITVVPIKAKPFPGGADEEDIRVLTALPEVPLSADSRAVQREVYKDLFKQELKDERTDTIEE